MESLKNKSALFALIAFLFVLSGIAALIYQVAWFKYLSYFLGNSTYAQSIVLATFMGGLAIGSWIWGKRADESKNALKLFAWLEVAIAIYCLLYFPIFEFVKKGFVSLVISQEWPSDSNIVLFFKLLVSILTILIPTILMGGTLPVLVRYLSDRIEEVGKNVSILYFINSLGAVIGSLAAGFYLLEKIGLYNTVYIGAFADLLVGVIFLIVVYAKKDSILKSTKKQKIYKKTPDKNKFEVTEKIYRISLIIAGGSGLCAMIYEVAWLRLLIPILGSTTYSFTLVLVTFITGITIGSLIIYFILPKLKKPFTFLGFCQFGIVVSILLTLPFYEKIPYLIWSDVGDNMKSVDGYHYYMSRQFYYTFLIMIIPTVFMGMSLPIASRLAVKKSSEAGESVGKIFAINTVGTVVGSLASGLLLIPLIGIKITVELALLINVLLATLVFIQPKALKNSYKLVVLITLVGSSAYYYLKVDYERWAYTIMTSAVSRKINRKSPPPTFEEFYVREKASHDEILYYKEGVGGTVVVTNKNDEVNLYTNGKGDANSKTDLRTQINLSQTPMILHPNPKNVYVIGFGAGTTIGNVLTHDRVENAKVAEISPEVIEASVYFNHVNQKPLSDSRLTLLKDDGVSALRLSPDTYDIIISQPSNPWSAGVGNLFTKDFFHDCKQKLNEGGYMAQWFNLYEMSDETLKMVLRTVLSEFEFIDLWQIGNSDLLMICSDKPINTNLDSLEKNYIGVKDKLELGLIKTFSTFLSQQFMSSEEMDVLKKYASSSNSKVINTENHPLLEHWAPQDYFLYSRPTEFLKLDRRNDFQNNKLFFSKYYKENEGLNYEETSKVAAFNIFEGNRDLALALNDSHPLIYLSWASREIDQGNYNDALFFLNRLAKFNNKLPELYKELSRMKLKQNDVKAALIYLDQGIKLNPNNADLFLLRSNIHLTENDISEAIRDLEKAISIDPKQIGAYNDLATIYAKQGRFEASIELLNTAEKYSKVSYKLYYNRGSVYGQLGDFKSSVNDFSKVIELDPSNGRAYFLRGKGYKSIGNLDKACSDFEKAINFGVSQAKSLKKEICN